MLKSLPKAKKINHIVKIHDYEISDNYHWMRDENWPQKVDNDEIINHLTAENDYYQHFMDPYEKEKNDLFEELKGRIQLSDQSAYVKKDQYYYYHRTEEHLDYPIYCRKFQNIDADEEIMLNVNDVASGREFTSVCDIAVSPKHNLIAYSVDFEGNEEYLIKIYDLKNKCFLANEIANSSGSIIWHQNSEILFYVPVSPGWKRTEVKIHYLKEKKQDEIIFTETDPLFSVNISKSASKNFMFIQSGGHDSNEIYYVNIKDSLDFKAKLIAKKQNKIHYSIDHGEGYFYKYSNQNAPNFFVARCQEDQINSNNGWEEYIKHDEEKYLSNFSLTKKYILLQYSFKGLPMLMVQDLENFVSKIVTFEDEAYVANIYSSNYFENDIRINYSALSRPGVIYNYDFDNNKLIIIKQQNIPSGHHPDHYQVKQIFVQSGGAQVPVSILYKKDLFKQDGSNPVYLYGYGAYGIAIKAGFKNSAISLADRGFIFAIAHIRGGDDLGYDWYEAAKFLNKKRSFEDFLNVSRYLCLNNYTSEGNITIAGGSAGGMLIGNVINQEPNLFKSAIAHVPFVDVLSTMLDETLPLTQGEFKEWGNPKEKEYFDYMKSYCPYQNIIKQNYPNLFVTAGLSDPRVGYWEAAKWVAKIRDLKTDSNHIIFKTNMSYGHQGASGRFDHLKENAEELIFTLKTNNKL